MKRVLSLNAFIEEIEIVLIKVSSVSEAIEMFERNNARGKDLAPSDLLKNYLYGKRPSDNKFEEKWTNIEQQSGSTIVRMIRYFYTSQKGPVTKRNLYQKLKPLVDENPDQFLDQLIEFSEFYSLMIHPDDSNFESYLSKLNFGESYNRNPDRKEIIIRHLQGLKYIGFTQYIPMIYSIISNIHNIDNETKKIHLKSFESILEKLENFHFHYNYICNGPTNIFEKLYANLAVDFLHTNAINEQKNHLLTELVKIGKPSFDDYKLKMTEIIYGRDNNKIKFIFDRLTNYGQKIRIDILTSSIYNIDHIFPQKPKKGTPLDKIISKDYTHKLGNLWVIPKKLNDQFNNILPSEKFKIINDNSDDVLNLIYTSEIAKRFDKDEWNEEAINKHTDDIINKCYNKVFNIN